MSPRASRGTRREERVSTRSVPTVPVTPRRPLRLTSRVNPRGDAERRHVFASIGPVGDIRHPRLNGVELVEQHPDTGKNFSAVTIPFWAAALDLVVRAHGSVPAFSRFVFLGWDVAITASGPLLIEANSGWGAVNLQNGDGPPLGRTALPAIALEYLEPPAAGDTACG